MEARWANNELATVELFVSGYLAPGRANGAPRR
jgi:hypothetical protein